MLSTEHIEFNWQKLVDLIKAINPRLVCILEKFEDNVVNVNDAINPVIYPGLKNAPAGVFNHHSYEGGLVEHLLEMWDTHVKIYKVLELGVIDTNIHLRSDEILEVIIIHDLHKGYCYYRYPTFKEDQDFIQSPTTTGYFKRSNLDHVKMAGDNGVSFWMCQLAGFKLSSLKSLNAILCSEGGYAKSPPEWQTVLAKYVYILDEISSNVLSRLTEGNVFNIRDKANTQSLSDMFLKDYSKD